MKWEQVESKWEQLIGSAKENWGKLSDDDFRQISGKREQLAVKIQETYGITRREAEKQVWDWGKTVENVTRKIA
ncbi:MAG TPA: CsbD family protein [Terriglobales bacterium]